MIFLSIKSKIFVSSLYLSDTLISTLIPPGVILRFLV
uniref:Uncharacterized protein n=1 Tax=virus sp. ctLl75 TaxID=2828249 RepID=A0A8S5RBC7_9VIRU|nr:MAG TPA: hypothetical protein [virus sp. ctLl75]